MVFDKFAPTKMRPGKWEMFVRVLPARFAPVRLAPGPTRWPLNICQYWGKMGVPVRDPVKRPFKFALARFTLPRLAEAIVAFVKFVPVRITVDSDAPVRLALVKVALVKFVPDITAGGLLRRADDRLAPVKFVFVRLAPLTFVDLRTALVKLALERLTPERFAPLSRAFCRLAVGPTR